MIRASTFRAVEERLRGLEQEPALGCLQRQPQRLRKPLVHLRRFAPLDRRIAACDARPGFSTLRCCDDSARHPTTRQVKMIGLPLHLKAQHAVSVLNVESTVRHAVTHYMRPRGRQHSVRVDMSTGHLAHRQGTW